MKRGKSAASVEMKQVIAALCRLLTAAGLEVVPPPETFRRAKFGGGPDVEGQLLQLLMEILQTFGTVSCKDGMEGGELRKQVIAGLWQTGYYGDWMYKGSGDKGHGGERSTSRDLLLALGWLIATGSLEKLLTKRVQQLDKMLLTPTHASLQLSSELHFDPASLRRLQWLTGCLRHQGWSLLSMQEERAHLLHAVVLGLLPSSISFCNQSSPLIKEDCMCIWQLCDLLEAYLSWKKAETIFWTWMDSVFDSSLTDPLVEKLPCVPDGRRECYHGKRGLETLEEMLLTLPRVQTQERRNREKPEDSGQGVKFSGRADGPFLPPLLFPLLSVPSFLQVYRPRLKSVNSSNRPAENATRERRLPDELPISEAQQLLQCTKTLLWDRKLRHRLANRLQMQELIDRLHGLVLIPP
ncbi:tubulin epsilon and delta complex protein 1 isoform X1 [Takifugu flavidus]|uniref:tubulin epsilon and delta complex protein 1 isoform X1 n=1 Tax=Takifugu flavidus TaxID=433684 RepID=UPI0025440900|nr:tubulin epsilon and delta complex protein 1 isoform X1 [Takifugu flavidus]